MTSQSLISGDFAGNINSNNDHRAATSAGLIAGARWVVSPCRIDLGHLRDEYNLPEANTGAWIFEDVKYMEWRQSTEPRLLWLCGGPGTGKTMLAKRVAAKFLEEADGPSKGAKLAFHFVSPELPMAWISATEPQLRQLMLTEIARDLLSGIRQQDGDPPAGSEAEFENQVNGPPPKPESPWDALGNVIRRCHPDPVYILIDGVDGLQMKLCEELMSKIQRLMKIPGVRIFISSRNVSYISNNLPYGSLECIKISLDENHFVKMDVEAFIRHRVSRWKWDVRSTEKTIDTLLGRSEGIFLWASWAVGNLAEFGSSYNYEDCLATLPQVLREEYRKMLDTLLLPEGPGEMVLNMIWSVALALRPLTFNEFYYILARIKKSAWAEQRPPHEGTNSEIQLRTEEGIRTCVQSSLGFLRATATTVSVVHHSAREYLFNEHSEGRLPVLSKSETDLTLSWESFRYLHRAIEDPERLRREHVRGLHDGPQDSDLGPDHQSGEPEVTQTEVTRQDPWEAKWPYLRYAAEFWFVHARRSIKISLDTFRDDSACDWLQHQFFEASDAIRRPWIDLCGDSEMEILAGEHTALHIAACLGLAPLAEKALSPFTKGAGNIRSPLYLAANLVSGLYEILIAKVGTFPLTARNRDGNAALHKAAILGIRPMLVGLVEKSATSEHRARSDEINKKNCLGNTPLHLAFQFNHPHMVKFLVKHGADPTIENNAQVTVAELGKRLGRQDCLDILRQTGMLPDEVKKGTAETIETGARESETIKPLHASGHQLCALAVIFFSIILAAIRNLN